MTPPNSHEVRLLKIKLNDDVVFRDLSGESVLLNLSTGTYFGLNEVGTRVWALLTELPDVDRAIAALQAEFDVDPAQLDKDVRDLVQQFAAKGLLQIHGH